VQTVFGDPGKGEQRAEQSVIVTKIRKLATEGKNPGENPVERNGRR
jgi:hypothetical protein